VVAIIKRPVGAITNISLQQPLAAEADIAQLISLGLEGFQRWILGLPGAAFHLGAVRLSQEQNPAPLRIRVLFNRTMRPSARSQLSMITIQP